MDFISEAPDIDMSDSNAGLSGFTLLCASFNTMLQVRKSLCLLGGLWPPTATPNATRPKAVRCGTVNVIGVKKYLERHRAREALDFWQDVALPNPHTFLRGSSNQRLLRCTISHSTNKACDRWGPVDVAPTKSPGRLDKPLSMVRGAV